MTDFIKGTSPDWSGKMYRYGDVNTDRATFFHTDPEGAAYYAPGNSANEIGVHDFDESMIQKPVVFDIDFDEDIKAMAEARGYRYLTPNDIDTSTGDIALDIEEAMPSWEKEGHDSILIYGQTGAETVGNGPEIALFPKRK
jgi:hypothetical protein